MNKLVGVLLMTFLLLTACQEIVYVTEGYVIEVDGDKIYLAKNATWESFVAHEKTNVHILNENGKMWLILYEYKGDTTIQKGDKIRVWSDEKVVRDTTWFKGDAEKVELVSRITNNLNKCSPVEEVHQYKQQSSPIFKCLNLGLDNK